MENARTQSPQRVSETERLAESPTVAYPRALGDVHDARVDAVVDDHAARSFRSPVPPTPRPPRSRPSPSTVAVRAVSGTAVFLTASKPCRAVCRPHGRGQATGVRRGGAGTDSVTDGAASAPTTRCLACGLGVLHQACTPAQQTAQSPHQRQRPSGRPVRAAATRGAGCAQRQRAQTRRRHGHTHRPTGDRSGGGSGSRAGGGSRLPRGVRAHRALGDHRARLRGEIDPELHLELRGARRAQSADEDLGGQVTGSMIPPSFRAGHGRSAQHRGGRPAVSRSGPAPRTCGR